MFHTLSLYFYVKQRYLKGVQRPAAFAIVCFCFREFRTASSSGGFGEQVIIIKVYDLRYIALVYKQDKEVPNLPIVFFGLAFIRH